MRFTGTIFVSLGVSIAIGCTRTPPPNWAGGGARLTIPDATWVRGDDDAIVVRPDGKVLEDGDVLFAIDAAGRVFAEDGEPIAVLQPDGYLVGEEDMSMGFVGAISASPPGRHSAWLSIGNHGQVTRYESDGERVADGRWSGCRGHARLTCTLITHVIAVREYQRRPQVGVGVGIGIMVHP